MGDYSVIFCIFLVGASVISRVVLMEIGRQESQSQPNKRNWKQRLKDVSNCWL